jgi:predicted nucleotidyltransferase component of viral defense system
MLQYQTVDKRTLALLREIQSHEMFSQVRLVGGTSLALQYGHRKSIDLDFFGQIEAESLEVSDVLSTMGSVQVLKRTPAIQIYEVDGIKVDMVKYNVPWLEEPLLIDGLVLANEKDIAAMKIGAITGRGSKKDFIDLFFLLKKLSLSEIMELYKKKFADANILLALKSLLYFSDAENSDSPEMLLPIDWEDLKVHITKEVNRYIIAN